ncbi:MAG: HDIG domain-containing protein [Bacteroidota bacterium]|nr:HDIG domain-containing protein [Bacteroidota bacterium]
MLKLGVVIISALFISFLLPKTNVIGHKVGEFDAIWSYKDLVVENDFFTLKSKSEIENEKLLIEKDAPLIFEERNEEKIDKLQDLETLKLKNTKFYFVLKPVFDSIYKVGVIESIDDDLVNKKPSLLQRGNYAEQIVYFDFFTIKSAANFITSKVEKVKGINTANINYLNYLAITHYFNPQKSDLYKKIKTDQLAIYKNNFKKGETIIKHGEQLTNEKRYLINNFFYNQNKIESVSKIAIIAKVLLVGVILLVLLVYLAFFRKQIFGQNKQVIFLFLIINITFLSTSFFYKYGLLIYSLPFALVPIIVRVFFDSRTALFTHLMTILLCSFFMADKLEFILLQLIAGIGTLFAVAEMRKRQQIVNAALIVLIFYVLIFISYQLAFGTPILVKKISAYLPFLISSTLVLLAYPLIFITEKSFGFISDFKLLELCDLNQPLLRRLSQEVPGTFQHSLQVANLAEEAIYYIGGNTLLVRTGAMYHDIGKLFNPKFFTENQGNSYSPHQEMQPLESAKIIISHVIKGIELAKKNKLPDQVIDFIRTHHGTTSVGYFYNLYKKNNPNEKLLEQEFKYKGPIPFSKETAVLMMADGVEAASRSLKMHDALTINDLVDSIIDYKIAQNQFMNSDITFRDITTIKKIFKKRLMTIYHARIEYPSS